MYLGVATFPSKMGGAPAYPKFLGPLLTPKRFELRERSEGCDNTRGEGACLSTPPFQGAGPSAP